MINQVIPGGVRIGWCREVYAISFTYGLCSLIGTDETNVGLVEISKIFAYSGRSVAGGIDRDEQGLEDITMLLLCLDIRTMKDRMRVTHQ